MKRLATAWWLRPVASVATIIALTLLGVATVLAQSPAPPTTAPEVVTTKDVLAIAISAIGILSTAVVGIYSGHQTTMIKHAQATADALRLEFNAFKEDILRNYETSNKTSRMLENAMQPMNKEIHRLGTVVEETNKEFMRTLINLTKPRVEPA